MLRTPENFDWNKFDTNILKPFLKNELFEGIIGKKELELLSKEDLVQKSGTVLIGIHDPDSDLNITEVTDGFDAVLELKFWDIEKPIGTCNPISPEQGKELFDFIIKNQNKRFLVHCHAGMSRSAGIGCAIECIVNFNSNVYHYKTATSDIRSHSRYFINWTVFDQIMEQG